MIILLPFLVSSVSRDGQGTPLWPMSNKAEFDRSVSGETLPFLRKRGQEDEYHSHMFLCALHESLRQKVEQHIHLRKDQDKCRC